MSGAGRRARSGLTAVLHVGRMLAFAWMLVVPAAEAHQQGVSASDLTVEGGRARYDLTLSSHDLQEIDADRDGVISEEEVVAQYPALRRRLERAMVVQAGDTPCPLTLQDFFIDPAGTVLFRFRGPCPDSAPLKVAFQLLVMTGAPGYDVARITFRGTLTQRIFTRDETTAVIGAADETVRQIVPRFLALGMRSAATRMDHALLLTALLMIVPGWRPAVAIVASYAAAQTGALVLSGLDVLAVPVRLLEAMGALAIAWVALENALFDRVDGRWRVALVCGVVQGLAIGAMLRAAPAPPALRWASVLAFAAAVVAADAVVGGVGAAAATILRRLPARRPAVIVVSAAVLVFGLYCFVARAFLA